jgi:hypothetical protein
METTQTFEALRALFQRERDADAPASLTRVMDALAAINGRKLTKRDHGRIHDAAGDVDVLIGPDGTGWTIQTRDHATARDGWRIRLSWQTTICPVVDVDAIRRENPSYFAGARDRNLIRDGYLAAPDRIRAIADAVDQYRAAAATLGALIDYPLPDAWLIRKRFANADARAFAQAIADFIN